MKRTQGGFSLLEVLVVAGIVLMLAGLVIPSFSTFIDDANEAAVTQELQRLRTAVDYYSFQHGDSFPGQDPGSGSWTEDAFWNQLEMATDADGNWAAVGTPGFPYGPYLTEGRPINPYNELDTAAVVAPLGNFPAPDDSTAWVFFADTGTIRANSTEVTPDGDPVWDL